MVTTDHSKTENPVGPQRQIGRLLAAVALMLVAGGLGALGAVGWEEHRIHQPRVSAAIVAPSGGSSVTARGNIGDTPFSAKANHDAKGFSFDVEVSQQ